MWRQGSPNKMCIRHHCLGSKRGGPRTSSRAPAPLPSAHWSTTWVHHHPHPIPRTPPRACPRQGPLLDVQPILPLSMCNNPCSGGCRHRVVAHAGSPTMHQAHATRPRVLAHAASPSLSTHAANPSFIAHAAHASMAAHATRPMVVAHAAHAAHASMAAHAIRPMVVAHATSSPQASTSDGDGDEAAQAQPLTGTIRVDVGDAVEQLKLPLQSEANTLLTVTLSMPMGLVLEESPTQAGLFVVVEVAPGSSAADKNVREGDVVRGVTAASMQMTYPTMNLMFGGVGRPKLKRIAVPVSGRPFSWVREAIKSNTQLPGNTITLVVEREGSGTKEQQQQRVPATGRGAGEAGAQAQPSSVFDPSLFE